MKFRTAVATCFGKFLTLTGRASRAEYWWFFLFVIVASAAAGVLDGLIFGFAESGEPGRHPVSMVVGFVTFFPALSAGWRRMQDSGHPGWLIVLPMIVLLGAVLFVMLGIAGFGLLEAMVAEPEQLRGVARAFGVAGLTAAYVAITAAGVATLWWLTRPGDPGSNAYGPPPRATPST